MKYGMIRVGAFTPTIKIGNPRHNAIAITELLNVAHSRGVEIAVFPELCITGYTVADLLFTRELLQDAVAAVCSVADAMPENMIAFVGAPIVHGGRLYNCAVGIVRGKILGITPKTELPDYGEFYEKRYYEKAFDGVEHCDCLDAPIGNVLYKCGELTVGCEICEDMWADVSPSVEMCRAGANVIVNLSASDEVVGKAEYRKLLIESASGKMHCAYVYADAGFGESSTDVVFSGHNIIAENGYTLAECRPFSDGIAIADADIERLDVDRRRIGLKCAQKKFEYIPFSLSGEIVGVPCRTVSKYPFIPCGDVAERAELILSMQSSGLKKRMLSSKAETLVIGVSGGLDSALALLVCKRAADCKNIIAVTMPCFGTSEKTLENAKMLCSALDVELVTVDIKNTVTSHLNDIAHNKTDVVYENAQARVRTLTLFDIANKKNGLVVGTGDLSELALGWCTYNGDHMSSYGVNAGVPKTLVKHLVAYEGKRLGAKAEIALERILNTEISPELLPPKNGKITQKTEDILGRYDILDFIVYHYCRYGFSWEKIEYLLRIAYADEKNTDLAKALDTFRKRFFTAQFKRSCMPDGVKIGSVSLSPRSDFRLPSDIER